MQSQTLSFKTKRDLHISRKLFHFLGVMFMVAFLMVFPQETCWLVYFSLGGSFIAIDLIRQKNKDLNQFALRFFGSVLRQSESNKLSGVTFLVLGAGLSLFLFAKPVLILALLFLGVGDPLASFVGVKYGKTKLLHNKSLQGSMAAFFACSLIAFFYFHHFQLMTENILLVSLLAGICGMVSEMIPLFKIDDNFTQPVLNGLFLSLLFHFFGGF